MTARNLTSREAVNSTLCEGLAGGVEARRYRVPTHALGAGPVSTAIVLSTSTMRPPTGNDPGRWGTGVRPVIIPDVNPLIDAIDEGSPRLPTARAGDVPIKE